MKWRSGDGVIATARRRPLIIRGIPLCSRAASRCIGSRMVCNPFTGRSHMIAKEAGSITMNSLEALLPRFAATIALLEAYDTPLLTSQCEEALSAVRDLQASLQQIPMPSPAAACVALMDSGASDNPQAQADAEAAFSALFGFQIALEYACAQADTTRLFL